MTRFAIYALFIWMIFSVPAFAQEGEARLRVLHLVPDAPEYFVQVDGESLSMGMIFGPASYLWAGDTMTTSTLNLPQPSLIMDSLPVGGVSPYDYVNTGDHLIELIDLESGDSLAQTMYTFPSEGFFSMLITGTPDALTLQVTDERIPLLEAGLQAETASVYTVVHNAPTIESLEFWVDDAPVITDLAYGDVGTIAVVADAHSAISVYGDGELLFEQALPTKTLLPNIKYVLGVVEMDAKTGVILHATYGRGITGQTADDLTIDMQALDVDVVPSVQARMHFFTLTEETTFDLIVEALPDSPLDPYVFIVDGRTGSRVAVNDDLEDNLSAGFENLTLPAGGYAVQVSGYAFSTLGAYRIRLQESE